jgi:hypothetical protein
MEKQRFVETGAVPFLAIIYAIKLFHSDTSIGTRCNPSSPCWRSIRNGMVKLSTGVGFKTRQLLSQGCSID